MRETKKVTMSYEATQIARITYGCLVIISVNVRPDPQPGNCMVCGGTDFRLAKYGWVECTGCFEFAILESDMRRIGRLSTPEMFTL